MNALFLASLLALCSARADEPVEMPGSVTAPPPASSGAATEATGEYEIDYEEEPGTEEAPEVEQTPEATPVPKQGKKIKDRKALIEAAKAPRSGLTSGAQGTHSRNRFAPMLKSETKSIYKKNGKPLDVDTD